MKTDAKGFIVSGARDSRTFVAVRASELDALERSKNRSLRALANAERQAKIDADPKLKAEQEKRRTEFADMVGFTLGPPVRR